MGNYFAVTTLACIFARYEERENRMNGEKRAILAVSFGTSYDDTRKKTIDRIEQDIREAYPAWAVYRAWTSGMIRRKIMKRDGIYIPDVREAMEQMERDGIREVIVQPTHVINGIENDLMTEEVLAFEGRFAHIVTGAPLLTSQEDNDRVVKAVADELHPAADEALVLMGHGTEHYANAVYAALDYQFKDTGYKNIFMGTVEAYPSFDSLLRRVREAALRRVTLAPFMIVAGDHAANDLSGAEEGSWKSRFENAGFEVDCVLKGLGEYPGIRQVFLDHIAASIRKLENEGAIYHGDTNDGNRPQYG